MGRLTQPMALPTAKEQHAMPPKKVTLPDHVKAAVLDEIAMDYQAIQSATDRMRRRVFLGLEQGLTQDEIADRLNALPGVSVTRQGVSLWKRTVEQQTRDRDGDRRPSEPGERQPVG